MRIFEYQPDRSVIIGDGTTTRHVTVEERWPDPNGPDQLPAIVDQFFGPAPAERRTLKKSLVQERVNALGKWGAVMGLLMTNGVPNIYYARWFAPDWPEVYADDAGLLQILQGAGCTAAEIAQITAA